MNRTPSVEILRKCAAFYLLGGAVLPTGGSRCILAEDRADTQKNRSASGVGRHIEDLILTLDQKNPPSLSHF